MRTNWRERPTWLSYTHSPRGIMERRRDQMQAFVRLAHRCTEFGSGWVDLLNARNSRDKPAGLLSGGPMRSSARVTEVCRRRVSGTALTRVGVGHSTSLIECSTAMATEVRSIQNCKTATRAMLSGALVDFRRCRRRGDGYRYGSCWGGAHVRARMPIEVR
jgi:hypothetical protein